MTISNVFGSLDPVRAEVVALLQRLEQGNSVDASAERRWVDLKEEAGRRDVRTGAITPGEARADIVAQQIAREAACMANTPGGGALLVGISNDGTLIGAVTEAEWLRQRVYEITRRHLTPDVLEVEVRGSRLLVVFCPPAVEPVRVDDRINWRVSDRCVEVDAATWHARRMHTLNYDWSGDASSHPASDARPQALAIARDFLRASSAPEASELASIGDQQLLRRLNAVTGDGLLTNAGAIAFVGRGQPALDYVYRAVAGADSSARARRPDRGLLEELAEVFLLLDANNSVRHIQHGLVVAQVQDVPRLAAREAIVNGVAHREWGLADPTVVEHIGRTLRVTSPGGFFGGVNESNILTHPSTSRNRALTQLLADLRVAEREGVGVDRMVREMLRVGHQTPTIREISGPRVRASLVGDTVDVPWFAWLGQLQPTAEAADVNNLLLLRRLVTEGWVDDAAAAIIIQLNEEEARGALMRLAQARMRGAEVITLVDGVPDGSGQVWRLSDHAKEELTTADGTAGAHRPWPTRAQVATSYARARGRISSTELGSLVSAHATNVGSVLKELQSQGMLEPSSASGRGRGFFYRWVGTSGDVNHSDDVSE